MSDLTDDQMQLLLAMRESQDHGAFAIACDGKTRAPAHALEDRGLAQWRGTNWGSSFYSITDAGRAFVQRAA